MKQIKILSVNISKKKGTIKQPAEMITLTRNGILGDAHAGDWHRQVSLLGEDSLTKMQEAVGRKLNYGDFAENITVTGYPLYQMRPLDLLISGDVILEVTQIGKKCHGEKCAIFRETGDCVMPKEGIFCRVLQEGKLKPGDLLGYKPRVIQVRIITLSDRASRGEYEDKSGPLLKQLTEGFFLGEGRRCETEITVLPDDQEQLERTIREYVREQVDIILTTGGTGIGPRDITPDVIRPMLTREIPGIMEMIRVKYGTQFPNALVSRSLAGVISGTLIYALPGSPKAAREYAEDIFKTVEHSMRMLHQIDSHI
jgi:molybdenum cofactor synthesis domain-containing protein